MKRTDNLRRWAIRQGTSSATIRATDYYAALERAAAIGFKKPHSIGLIADHEADRQAAIRAYSILRPS